jgi:hypothetical protein
MTQKAKSMPSGMQYAYIGLKRTGKTDDGKPLAPKSPGLEGVTQ